MLTTVLVITEMLNLKKIKIAVSDLDPLEYIKRSLTTTMCVILSTVGGVVDDECTWSNLVLLASAVIW